MSKHRHPSTRKQVYPQIKETLVHNHAKGDAPHTHPTWGENVPSDAWLNKHATKSVSSLLKF